MLTAILKNEQRICLMDYKDKQSLQKLRKEEQFFCPQCHENMILKLGNKRIFHFSHLKGTSCQYEHEKESEYHLNGKIQLYQWLMKQNLNPQMEFYDSKIKQRADILFYVGSRKYVIEYQCSNISEEIFRKRTIGYRANHYTPIWILGANHFNRKKPSITALSDFHYLFLQKYPTSSWMIPYYCSETETFILQESIQAITNRNVFSKQTIRKKDEFTILNLLAPQNHPRLDPTLWLKELDYWKYKQIQFHGSFQNSFLNLIYQNHLNLFLLPPYLGLPVLDSPFITTPPLIWQTYFFIDILLKRGTRNPFSRHDINMAFIKRISKKQIQLRTLPLVEKDYSEGDIYPPLIPVAQYVDLLVKTNIIRQLNQDIFQIENDLQIPNSPREQKDMENAFYQKYANIIF
ncbi:competence protein CoiA [Neobacillus sp. D3-1R]|uniref:competence protein CoiA n=1 Tax=Neobacillus sp. D3-1R TaxID=3445778 RepID=UPI003FA0C427